MQQSDLFSQYLRMLKHNFDYASVCYMRRMCAIIYEASRFALGSATRHPVDRQWRSPPFDDKWPWARVHAATAAPRVGLRGDRASDGLRRAASSGPSAARGQTEDGGLRPAATTATSGYFGVCAVRPVRHVAGHGPLPTLLQPDLLPCVRRHVPQAPEAMQAR